MGEDLFFNGYFVETDDDSFVVLFEIYLVHPWVIADLFDGVSFLLISVEDFADEIFSFFREGSV